MCGESKIAKNVGLVNKFAEGCDTLGHMNDISKLISGLSGAPLEIVLTT